jgi:serine/threonine protein kinase
MTNPAQPKDPFIGRDILNGQFQILQKIGSGGMGSVYKALQPAMNRMVAVKILHPKLTSRKDLASRFRREARAMSHLTHPNTVKVFLYGELEDGSLYIVMEFLEGKNLNQTVRSEGPMPVERAIPILVQVCNALEEAHRAGIIHRDLKPENIFLCQQGGIKDYAKVLDFGLAKVTEREMRPGSVILTQEGMVFGTPEFMSPEQAQGKTLTPASDLYSLAVILYEALTGKLPFVAKNAMEYIQLHVTAKPTPIQDNAPPGRTFPPLDGAPEGACEGAHGPLRDRDRARRGALGRPRWCDGAAEGRHGAASSAFRSRFAPWRVAAGALAWAIHPPRAPAEAKRHVRGHAHRCRRRLHDGRHRGHVARPQDDGQVGSAQASRLRANTPAHTDLR